MGNALKCFRGEDEERGRRQDGTSMLVIPDPVATAPRRHQQGVDLNAFIASALGLTQAADGSLSVRHSGVVDSQSRYQSNEHSTEDIDESSAEGLCSAQSYAKANPLLIEVPVLGTSKNFWRLTDKFTRITRKLALILRSHHAVGKHLAAPLQVSNVWIGGGGAGVVKLRGVSFTAKGFGFQRVRDDYRQLARLLLAILRISSGGDVTSRLPPDYREFLVLLESDTLDVDDEFLIVNYPALLPMKNRTEAFLMLHDRIVKHLGRTDRAKKRRILAGLPYEGDWLETATANARINQWVANVQVHEYRRTQSDLLRLNRNVRSHLHEYGDDEEDAGGGMEEVLYCE